jgi:phosphinothricin acetyltransferase
MYRLSVTPICVYCRRPAAAVNQMADHTIRAATPDDLQALTDIYNHYIVHTAITFELQPLTAEQRRAWFDAHHASGPHRLLVATDARGGCVGYASSSRWRPKPAYDPTVETSVYCHPDAIGQGYGTALYAALFDALSGEDVHTAVAGVALPNPASLSLHERVGFTPVGVFHAVGRKFDRFWDVAWFERPLMTPQFPGTPMRRSNV